MFGLLLLLCIKRWICVGVSEDVDDAVLVKLLHSRGYDSNPVKAWKESQSELVVRYIPVHVCDVVISDVNN